MGTAAERRLHGPLSLVIAVVPRGDPRLTTTLLRAGVYCCVAAASAIGEGNVMGIQYAVVAAMVAGIAIGASLVQGLHAQTKPPAYVVIAVQNITDAEAM